MSKYWKVTNKKWNAYLKSPSKVKDFFTTFIVNSLYIGQENLEYLLQQLKQRVDLLDGKETLEEAYIKGAYYTILFGQMDYEEHLQQYTPIEDIFKKFDQKDELTLFNIVYGISYFLMGNKDLACRYFLQSESDLSPESPYTAYHIICLNHLSQIYLELGEYEKAEEYNTKSYIFSEKSGDKVGLFRCLIERGHISIVQKRYDRAKDYLKTALMYSKDHQLPPRYHSQVLSDLGEFYLEQNDLEKSRAYLLDSLVIRKAEHFYDDLISTLISLAEVEFRNAVVSTGLAYLDEAEQLAHKLVNKAKLKKIYAMLAQHYEDLENYKTALHYFKLFQQLGIEISGEESARQVKLLKMSMEIEHSRRENEQLTYKNEEINLQKQLLESKKSEVDRLLSNILPEDIARELQSSGKAIARYHENISVGFADFVDFTQIAERLNPDQLVAELDDIFRNFDDIISEFRLEKIKTIGDAYMFAGGLDGSEDFAYRTVKAGLAMQKYLKQRIKRKRSEKTGVEWRARVGIHTGPVTAGVVGKYKFAYDIWGVTVILASRMESTGEEGRVNISKPTYEWVQDRFKCEYRGKIEVKNRGALEMYFVDNRK